MGDRANERKPPTMGDRANVYIKGYQDEPGVYLYAHWGGSELPETVRRALARGEDRWDDHQYLARIVFSEMIQGDLFGTTGFGISAVLGDGAERVLVLDPDIQHVSYAGQSMPFKVFVGQPVATWNLQPAVDPNAPLSQEQRQALFAFARDIFGTSDQQVRRSFTKTVLGRDNRLSWASNGGGITYGEASKVLDALSDLAKAMGLPRRGV